MEPSTPFAEPKGMEKWEEEIEGVNPFDEPEPIRPIYAKHLFSHGDTLASIAMRYKMDLDELLRLNRLNRWSHVRTGHFLYYRLPMSQEQRQKVAEDTEVEEGATEIPIIGNPERAKGARSHSLDEQRDHAISPTRAPFGKGTLFDLSKSSGLVEEELLLKAARDLDANSSSGGTGDGGGKKGKEVVRQRSRVLIDASLDSKSDVYRDDRVKYAHGQDHVMGILVVTSYRFIFQPSSSDLLVQKKGFLDFQLNISIRDIYDCSEEAELSQYLSAETYVQVCVKQKVGPTKAGAEGKVVNGKILYFVVSLQRSQALVKKVRAAMGKHKDSGNALSHRRDKSAAVLPRRSVLVAPESYLGSAADPKLHDGTSSLLLPDDIRAIQNMLPVRERSCDWQLIYSSEKHGVALSTFYKRARNKGPTVMVVEDSMHHVFGAFCSESWQVSEKYYGTGNSFLFKLYPKKAFYLWTGANNFVQLSSEEFLSVGGGSGTMGLWLNDDFSSGVSQTCDTFGNAPLASAEEFSVLVVEVWGFVSSD